MSKIEETVHQGAQVMQGKVAGGSHPLHPALVHLPIGFLTAGFALDTLTIFPKAQAMLSAASILPAVPMLNVISHYSLAAGVLFAAPAIATGLGELYEMARAQAINNDSVYKTIKDAYTQKNVGGEKLKTTITHATLNDLVVGIAAYNWWTRRSLPNLGLPRFNAYLSAAAIPIFLYSAYLGGSLVYEYGVGVQRQGKAVEIKERQKKEQ